jgi:hypothetical protein
MLLHRLKKAWKCRQKFHTAQSGRFFVRVSLIYFFQRLRTISGMTVAKARKKIKMNINEKAGKEN